MNDTCNSSHVCVSGGSYNSANDATTIVISTSTANVLAGNLVQVTLTAKAAPGYPTSPTDNTYSGTVTFTSSDAAATLPSATISGGVGTANISFHTAGLGTTLQASASKQNSCDLFSAPSGSMTFNVYPYPNATVTPSAARINAGAAGSASVLNQMGALYSWSIMNGSLVGATNAPTVSFTAGASGYVTLTETTTSGAGYTDTESGQEIICAAPSMLFNNQCVTGTISASPIAVTMGGTTTLSWNGSTSLSPSTERYQIFAGSAPLTCLSYSGSGTYTPTVTAASTTYSLVATSSCSATTGTTVATATVTGDPVPITPTITAPSFANQGQTGLVASVAPQAGITFTWSAMGANITSALTGTSIVFTAGTSASATLQVTAKNSATTPATAGPATFVVATPHNGLTGTSPVTQGDSQTISWSGTTLPVPDIYELSVGGVIHCQTGAGQGSYSYTVGTATPVTYQLKAATACNQTGFNVGSPLVVTSFPPPSAVITAPTSMVSTATATASVPTQSNASYSWTIQNGQAIGASNAASFRYSPIANNSYVFLTCTVSNLAGSSSTGTWTTDVSCGEGQKACNSSCIADTDCCSASDCAPPSWDGGVSGTAMCGVALAGECSAVCSAGYKQCGADCIPDAGCCE